MKKLTIRIDDDLYKKLGHYCVDEDKTFNQVIVDLLKQLLEKKTKR